MDMAKPIRGFNDSVRVLSLDTSMVKVDDNHGIVPPGRIHDIERLGSGIYKVGLLLGRWL